MAKRQAEEVAVQLSQDFDAFYTRPLAPPQAAGEEKKILVISADGKGIVMHPGDDTTQCSDNGHGFQFHSIKPQEDILS